MLQGRFHPGFHTLGQVFNSINCTDIYRDTDVERYAKIIAIITVTLLCICLNSLVIYLVSKNSNLHKSIYILFASLSCSDMLIVVTRAARILSDLIIGNQEWKLDGGTAGIAVCKLYAWIYATAPLVSLVTLVFISYERFRAMARATSIYTPMTKRGLIILVALSWFTSGLISIYFLLTVSVHRNPNTASCGFRDKSPALLPYVVILSTYVVIIFGLFLYLNIKVLIELHKTAVTSPLGMGLSTLNRQARLQSATKLILSIIFLIFVCWAPRYVVYLLQGLSIGSKISIFQCTDLHNLYFSLDALFCLGCSLSPLVYLVFLREFRFSLRACCVRSTQDERRSLIPSQE